MADQKEIDKLIDSGGAENDVKIQEMMDQLAKAILVGIILSRAISKSIEKISDMLRDFAVVAEEVRKLAEQSSNTVGEVKPIIVNVQKSVKELSGNIEDIMEFMNSKVNADYKFFVKTGEQYMKDTKLVSGIVHEFADNAKKILIAIIREINSLIINVYLVIEQNRLLPHCIKLILICNSFVTTYYLTIYMINNMKLIFKKKH